MDDVSDDHKLSVNLPKLNAKRPPEPKIDVKFTSLEINCESCHGPAKEHSTIMSGIVDGIVNPDTDIGIVSAVGLSTDESLDMCFQCHAVKTPLRTDYLPGDDLHEFYSLKMPLIGNENPFGANGRIKTFGYSLNHLYYSRKNLI